MSLRTTYNITDPVRSLRTIHCGYSKNDSGSTETSLHGEGGAGFRPDPSNIGDEALFRRASKKRTPGAKPGHTSRNASRWYRSPSCIKPILNRSDIRR